MCFDKVLAWPIAHAGFRALTFASAYATSSDFHPVTQSGLRPFFSGIKDARQLIKITDVIDDNIDNTDIEVLTKADFSLDENGANRFLRDQRYVPQAFWSTLELLDAKGIVEYDVAIGYSNIFCDYVRERAERQMSLETSPDTGLRRHMADANIDFAGLFGSFFFGLVQPPQRSLRDSVSYGTVKSAYPEVFEINRAGQILDDLRDLILDIEDEAKGGQVSPNIILSRVPDVDRMRVKEFSVMATGRTSIPVSEMPVPLQKAVNIVEREFGEIVQNIHSRLSRNIMESFWRNTIAEDIPTSQHPHVIKKMAIEAQFSRAFDRQFVNG